jgi:hypothetical protein
MAFLLFLFCNRFEAENYRFVWQLWAAYAVVFAGFVFDFAACFMLLGLVA